MLTLHVIGNLGAAPELRYTQDGNPVCKFSVAATYGVKQADGIWENVKEWIQVSVFGKRAESLCSLLEKGSRVYVSGKLQVRPWIDRSNGPRAGLQLMADTVEMMSAKRENDPDVYGKDYGEIPADQIPF